MKKILIFEFDTNKIDTNGQKFAFISTKKFKNEHS